MFSATTLQTLAARLAGRRSASVAVDVDPLDFVRAGAESFSHATYFGSTDGPRLGGLGVAWRTTHSGHSRFDATDADLDGVGWDEHIRLLFGFSFDADGPRRPEWDGFAGTSLHVPQAMVVDDGGSRRLVVALRSGTAPAETIDALATLSAPGRPALPEYADHVIEARPSPGEWREEVAQAIAAIKAGAMHKAVLARSVLVRTDGPILAFDLVDHLGREYPQCFAFGWQVGDATFIGASPELLIERSGRSIRTQPLAGSAPRGRGDEEDRALGEALMASAKDRIEHALVVEDVASRLSQVTSSLSVPQMPSLRKMTTVQHLSTTLTGELRGDHSVIDLAGILHPTPAVGGTPRQEALAFIDKVEGIDRGWYLGGVGWCSPDGEGQIAVALRCGLLRGDTAYLQAGAGIVADSDPEAELIETRLKFGPLLDVLTAT